MSTQNGVSLLVFLTTLTIGLVKFFQTTAADGLILRLVIHPSFPHARQQRFALEREWVSGVPPGAAWHETKPQDHARAPIGLTQHYLPQSEPCVPLLCEADGEAP